MAQDTPDILKKILLRKREEIAERSENLDLDSAYREVARGDRRNQKGIAQ
jgi:hypothetical protein